jgi:hypothetical protein
MTAITAFVPVSDSVGKIGLYNDLNGEDSRSLDSKLRREAKGEPGDLGESKSAVDALVDAASYW